MESQKLKTLFFPVRQFACFLAMAVLLVLMAVEGRILVRALLVVPVLVLYVLSLVFFARDYDLMGMEQWKKKEERLHKEFKKLT